MERYDLRHLKDDFDARMGEIMDSLKKGESAIFLFEVGDFGGVQRSADLVESKECTLMNSLRYNEVDWTIVVKREKK